jgi:hypothetical protein
VIAACLAGVGVADTAKKASNGKRRRPSMVTLVFDRYLDAMLRVRVV